MRKLNTTRTTDGETGTYYEVENYLINFDEYIKLNELYSFEKIAEFFDERQKEITESKIIEIRYFINDFILTKITTVNDIL